MYILFGTFVTLWALDFAVCVCVCGVNWNVFREFEILAAWFDDSDSPVGGASVYYFHMAPKQIG